MALERRRTPAPAPPPARRWTKLRRTPRRTAQRGSRPRPRPRARSGPPIPTRGAASAPRSPCHQDRRSGRARRSARRARRRRLGCAPSRSGSRAGSRGGVTLLDRGRQQVDRGLQPARGVAAALAAVEVRARARPSRRARARRARRRRGRRTGARRRVESPAHGSTSDGPSAPIRSASATLIFSKPSRIRPFTVPSGIPSISAISEWVKPPK